MSNRLRMHTFIDNTKQVRRFYLLAAATFFTLLALIFFRESLGMSMHAFRLFIAVIVIAATGTFIIMRPAYIRYENDEHVLRLYFYYLFSLPFVRRVGKMIEIRRDEFRDYRLDSYNYGLSKLLVLLVHERFALLPYPPVSVSLLSRKQLSSLIASLERWKE